MPTYEYHCDACEADIEVFQSMKDDPLKVCPECKKRGKIHRRISGGAGLIFKGSGFYETDYKTKKGSKPDGESKSSDSSKSETSKSEAASTKKETANSAS